MQEMYTPAMQDTPARQTDVTGVVQDPARKTAHDFFRNPRMDASVNKTTVGVETDSVTPDLLLATTAKMLKINKREVESDPKDSLEFQRIFGPAEYFAEHVMRDGNRLARQMLWKATNKGNVDWVGVGALDQHVNDVFNSSKMANMVDGSSPLELAEAAMKITRIGEGGVADIQSAPTEMRLVQPSFLGFIDPVRSVESLRVGLDAYLTKHCMKGSDGKLYQYFIDARTGKKVLLDSVTAAKSVVTTPDMMQTKTRNVFAMGGKTGVRIVPRNKVDYYLPNMDDAFTTASNMVPGMSAVKEMRLLMGCLHPDTQVLVLTGDRMLALKKALDIKTGERLLTHDGRVVKVRRVVSGWVDQRGMYKVRTLSGRVAVVTPEHKWPVLQEDGTFRLSLTTELKEKDLLPRITSASLPSRRTFIQGLQVVPATGAVLGAALVSASFDNGNLTIEYPERLHETIEPELSRRSCKIVKTVRSNGNVTITFNGDFAGWIGRNIYDEGVKVVPSEILSTETRVAAAALDAYTSDIRNVAEDQEGGTWLINIEGDRLRMGIALVAQRVGLDADFRDKDGMLALHLRGMSQGSWYADPVASVAQVSYRGLYVDIDVNDDVYALGTGLVTHNSKYPQQAVSVEGREAPLVRMVDSASGKDIQTIVGKYLGAQYTPKNGKVVAVRKDRVDLQYEDGTKGSVALYNNFPMNAKGYITSTPQVKAGDVLKKGDLVASSNYTDDKGVSALGANLRTGWISWKGGTYEDAIVLSESAAKKLTSTTMYSKALDLDRTVQLGKHNYTSWKPSEFNKEQTDKLDADGIVTPGTVLHKGDPMVLAVRVTEPSPGTMGRRVLTDMSETWEHDHPGVVTDVVRTKTGVKVMTTVSAPLEVGDKVAGSHGNKGIVSMVLPDDQMPQDANGKPLEVLLSPLGLVSRCYSADTELLTGKGWKRIDEVADNDSIMQFQPLTMTERLVPQEAPMHSARYKDVMLCYEDDVISFCVTPKHTMPVYGRKGNIDIIKAEKIYGKDVVLPVNGASTARIPDFGPVPEVVEPRLHRLDPNCWSKEQYVGRVYCPTVESGFVVTRRNGRRVCLGNTNPAQLHETLLGKVAKKTGRPELIPAFYEGNLRDHVLKRLQDNGLKADDDFFDPEDGRKIPNVVNGYTHLYKLKHLAESKLAARGTDAYSSDDTPGGSGYEGCFPAAQTVMTLQGPMSIATICEKRLPVPVLTYDDDAGWCYRQVTDWFIYRAPVETILNIATEFNLSDACGRSWIRHHTNMYPTANHQLYKSDMTKVMAAEVKVGDMLAGVGYLPTDAQRSVVIGTLLGDSSFTQDGALTCEHAKGQDGWITWKHKALQSLGATCPSRYYDVKGNIIGDTVVKPTKARMLRVPKSAFLDSIRDIMLKDSRRTVSLELLEQLGELGFCTWFLDDGSVIDKRSSKSSGHLPEASLATNGFTPDETRLIAAWLRRFLVLDKEPTLSRCDRRDGTEAYAIRFSRAASWKIVDMVSRNIPWHVIPASKKMLVRYCKKVQEDKNSLPEHDFKAVVGVSPLKVLSVTAYKHDKPDVLDIPVYDFTVDKTHRYTLAGGILVSNSKRLGTLEVSALAGHAAMDTLLDAKLIRGQSNADFWRSIRTGGIPTIPGEPLVQKKFFAHLQGAGVNVRKTKKGISVFALSESDVKDMAGPRELKTKDTYEAKNFRPINGGLFGTDIFGQNGDRWAYIQLDEPMPNPVMAEPLAKLLRMSDKDFEAVTTGSKTVDGLASASDIKSRLAGIDLEKESAMALKEFKDASKSVKDKALKRYVAIEQMRRQGVRPDEYMLTRVPVLPPAYRPVTSHAGLTMVADANYLYAQLMDARDDLRDAKDLPDEYKADARKTLYRSWQELTGMYEPEDVKLRNKNVGGLLQWALGKGSPKFSAFQRKILGTSVDTVGRGVIMPDSKLTIDEMGMPVDMAFDTMAPFVTRALVKRGYTPMAAMKMIKERSPQALDVLKGVMDTHPVLINRAPTLHKFSIMAFKPKLVNDKTIHIHPSVCPGFGADFDGDSVENRVRLVLDLNKIKEKIANGDESHLTSLEKRVYCVALGADDGAENTNNGDTNMIAEQMKCAFATATCRLDEVPVIAGSKTVRGNVTEWDVPEGFYFDTIDPETGEHELSPITKVSRHTDLKMYDITVSTRGSYSHVITASDDHSLIVSDKLTGALRKETPLNAKGALVPAVLHNNGNLSANCLRHINIGKNLQASHELGYVLGVILGDGWVDTEDCLRIACAVPELQQYLLDVLSVSRGVIPLVRDSCAFKYKTTEDRFGKNDAERITVYATLDFRRALRDAIGTGAANKHMPGDCLCASRAHMTGMLMGLLATDGTVNYSAPAAGKKSASKAVQYHTTSVRLRDDVQALCLRLGIRTGVTPYVGKHSTVPCYAIGLSLEDLAREYRKTPSLFKLHHAKKQAALDRIVEELKDESPAQSHNLVPFPGNLRGVCVYAGVNTICKDIFNRAIASGYTSRAAARKILAIIDGCDLDQYAEPTSIPKKFRLAQSTDEVKCAVDLLRRRTEDDDIVWELVTDVVPSGCTVGWDCTVPGPYTFTLAEGTVVQDTVNVHVPVSDNARREAWNRMRPSRNLLTTADHKVVNKPEKEYMQGLYIATRLKEDAKPVNFRSMAEAQEAYRRGEIEVDTPIRLLNSK